MKRFAIGTCVGGVTTFAVGFLIFELAFADFIASNRGSATGVVRDTNLYLAIFLGELSLAALVTLAIGRGPGPATIAEGFKVGAIVGFLVWFGVDLIHYGVWNVSNLTATLTDPVLETVRTGIVGAVIAAALARS